jgi:AcrR family transcriptional regulator
MLIYHFGSREGLLVAVTQAVEAAERAAAFSAGATVEDARRFWARISDPKLWPQERLFFELYAHALLGRPGTEGFLDGIIESWAAPIEAAMIEAGVDNKTARDEARLSVAVTRGLLLDLLATGDREGVTEAFERYLSRNVGARDRNIAETEESAVNAVSLSPKRATSARGQRTDQCAN